MLKLPKIKLPVFGYFISLIAILSVAVFTLFSLYIPFREYPGLDINAIEISEELDNVLSIAGLDFVNTSGWREPLKFGGKVTEVKSGVFVLDSGAKDPRDDRFSILYSESIKPIYGLGRVVYTDQVELEDFTDVNFGFGNAYSDKDNYSADNGRMRTPIFILPTKNTIIAYLSPYPAMVRLSRSKGKTELVLKNNPTYIGSQKGDLVIITKPTLEESYAAYYSFLKDYKGFETDLFFKKPHFKAFGLYWETYDQFGCSATLSGIKRVLSTYQKIGVFPSIITIGSGYWNTNDLSGCDDTHYTQSTTTDTFKLSTERMLPLDQFNKQISDWRKLGAYLTIGMRHIIYPSNENLNRVSSLFKNEGVNKNLYLDEEIYYGNRPSSNVKIINLRSPDVLEAYLKIIRNGYGDIMGIKEDDMLWADQKRVSSKSSNLDFTLFQNVFRTYSESTNNDFINFGSTNLFGVGTDGQFTPGFIHQGNWATPKNNASKYLLDTMLSQVYSGYPHPIMESWTYPCSNHWKVAGEKDTYRTYQLTTFLPITQRSCDYNQLKNKNYVKSIDWFTQLRERLHKYSYDKAQDWYYTGVPTLMRPLNLYEEWKNDANVTALYTKPTASTASKPKNEYMFGNALLIRPIFDASDKVNVYLPKGEWLGFIKKTEKLKGPMTYSMDLTGDYLNYPAFLKEGEILLISSTHTKDDPYVYIYMNSSTKSSVYSYYKVENDPNKPSPITKLQVIKVSNGYTLKNLTNNKSVKMVPDSYGKGFQTAAIKGIL